MSTYTEKQIEWIIDRNQKLLFILGVATTVMMDCSLNIATDKRKGVQWIMEAIENVVYQDKNLPPLPNE